MEKVLANTVQFTQPATEVWSLSIGLDYSTSYTLLLCPTLRLVLRALQSHLNKLRKHSLRIMT